MYTFEDLVTIIAELRSEHGCPWDREQTHESLKKCLADEAQEVFDAVDNQDMENLCEELGDVLLQVMMNSQIAKEEGAFTIDDVVDGLCRKMVRRHPHVFGDAKVTSVEEGLALWNAVKEQEKQEKKKKSSVSLDI
jgi:tetrapyrrole methylase family protein/MazG family protein